MIILCDFVGACDWVHSSLMHFICCCNENIDHSSFWSRMSHSNTHLTHAFMNECDLELLIFSILWQKHLSLESYRHIPLYLCLRDDAEGWWHNLTSEFNSRVRFCVDSYLARLALLHWGWSRAAAKWAHRNDDSAIEVRSFHLAGGHWCEPGGSKGLPADWAAGNQSGDWSDCQLMTGQPGLKVLNWFDIIRTEIKFFFLSF